MEFLMRPRARARSIFKSAQLLLRKGRHNPLRHSRWIVLVCVITDGARDTRRPAITGATAEPRAVWVGFADPPAVVATCAEPHLKRLLVAVKLWEWSLGTPLGLI